MIPGGELLYSLYFAPVISRLLVIFIPLVSQPEDRCS